MDGDDCPHGEVVYDETGHSRLQSVAPQHGGRGRVWIEEDIDTARRRAAQLAAQLQELAE
jgi:hypothetical protein